MGFQWTFCALQNIALELRVFSTLHLPLLVYLPLYFPFPLVLREKHSEKFNMNIVIKTPPTSLFALKTHLPLKSSNMYSITLLLVYLVINLILFLMPKINCENL